MHSRIFPAMLIFGCRSLLKLFNTKIMNNRLFCHPLPLLFIKLAILDTSIIGNILSYGAPVQYRNVGLNGRNYGLLKPNNSIHTAIENRLFSNIYKLLLPPEAPYDVKSGEEKMVRGFYLL